MLGVFLCYVTLLLIDSKSKRFFESLFMIDSVFKGITLRWTAIFRPPLTPQMSELLKYECICISLEFEKASEAAKTDSFY